jgi:hypothetical protein
MERRKKMQEIFTMTKRDWVIGVLFLYLGIPFSNLANWLALTYGIGAGLTTLISWAPLIFVVSLYIMVKIVKFLWLLMKKFW